MLKTSFLVSIVLLLAACEEVDFIYVVDTDNKVCSERKVVDKQSLRSKWVRDLPLSSCDGFIAITPKDFVRLQKERTGKK